MPENLLSLNEYAAARGKLIADIEAAEQAQINFALSAASQAIRAYVNRDFTLAVDAIQGTRDYRYQDPGTLEIDDATSIVSVAIKPTTFQSGRTLDASEWFAIPMSDGIISYIEFLTYFVARGASPAMGFERNLDTIGYLPYPIMITVNAVWGWPIIPSNVKQAMVMTVAAFMADPTPYTAEAIAGYSRSRGAISRGSLTPGMLVSAVPEQAAALLDQYMRWAV